jgi:hypothetical protein
MQTLCRLKPGKQSEIADESNFNFRCFTEISMVGKSLNQKKITASYVRPASTDYVLDVDWANSL